MHAGSSLDNVSIASARNGVALNLAAASADRVVVRSSGPSGACGAADATLTNSVCASSTPLSGATVGVLTGDGHDILRNDTFYSTASGSQPGIRIRGLGDVGAPATADIVNVIARGEKSGGAGIEAYSDGSEDSTVNISSSNASVVASPSAPAREHVNTDATDQSPNEVFSYWMQHFSEIFPIQGAPDQLHKGQNIHLSAYGEPFPVHVSDLTSHYFKFTVPNSGLSRAAVIASCRHQLFGSSPRSSSSPTPSRASSS